MHNPAFYFDSATKEGASPLAHWLPHALAHSAFTKFVDAQAVFFIPYLSMSNAHERPIDDVYALGKTMFISMIGVVSLEVRHWY